jgi:hypothetical protein
MDQKSFIVMTATEPTLYFTMLREGTVYGSPYPSFATCMEYLPADEISRRLRQLGYADAIVCDLTGIPVTADTLKSVQPVSQAKILEYWDDRPSESDWAIFRAVAAGEDFADLAKRLKIKPSELLKRLEDANRRISGTCDEIHHANADRAALTAITTTPLAKS